MVGEREERNSWSLVMAGEEREGGGVFQYAWMDTFDAQVRG